MVTKVFCFTQAVGHIGIFGYRTGTGCTRISPFFPPPCLTFLRVFFCSMGISERRKDVRRMTEVTFSLPANVLQHSAGTTSLRLAIYIFIIPRLALKICLMILTAVFHRGMLNKAVKAIIALMFFGEPSKASPLTVNVLLDRTDFVQKDISERRVPGFTFSGL